LPRAGQPGAGRTDRDGAAACRRARFRRQGPIRVDTVWRVIDPYHLLKLVHVGAAIFAVGSNLTYAFWMALAGRDRQRVVFAMSGIRWIDRTIANPAYIVLAITGVLMVITGQLSFTALWIWTAIVLYVTTAVVGIVFYAPAVRTQLAEAEADPTSDAYAAAARRSNVLGVLTLVTVSVIVGLMVLKPA
jgi:uncharacterized membrane protein